MLKNLERNACRRRVELEWLLHVKKRKRHVYDRCYDESIKSLVTHPPVWRLPTDVTATGPVFCIPSLGASISVSTWMSLMIWHTEPTGEFLHTERHLKADSASEYNCRDLSITILTTYTHSFQLPYLIITKILDVIVNWTGNFFWHFMTFNHLRYDLYFSSILFYTKLCWDVFPSSFISVRIIIKYGPKLLS